jgi:hypothetical protein
MNGGSETRIVRPSTFSLRPSIVRSAAFALIASLSIASTGCDRIKKMLGPRLDKPTVGTRAEQSSPLDVTTRAPKAKFLGCDLKYWNMPAGTKIKLAWAHYGTPDGTKADVETAGEQQTVQGSGVIKAFLHSDGDEFPPGTYECRWEAMSSKTVDNGEQSARITIGDESGKKPSDDDDDEPKKKK